MTAIANLTQENKDYINLINCTIAASITEQTELDKYGLDSSCNNSDNEILDNDQLKKLLAYKWMLSRNIKLCDCSDLHLLSYTLECNNETPVLTDCNIIINEMGIRVLCELDTSQIIEIN